MTRYYGKHTPESLAAHNVVLVNKLSQHFAAVVNTQVEFEFKSHALSAMAVFEAACQDVLRRCVLEIKNNYSSNWYAKGVFFSHLGPLTQYYAPLSEDWAYRKFKAATKQGANDTNASVLNSNHKGQINRFSYWHGYGHLNIPTKSSKNSQSLKSWAMGLEPLTDSIQLYKMLGEAEFQTTGDILKEGFVRKDGRIFKVTGMHQGKPKLKRSTLKEAINWNKLKYARQLKGKGFVVKKQADGSVRAYLSGKQVSLLDLNAAGLVGTKLQIAAFNNFFASAPEGSKFAQMKDTHQNENFFLKAMQSQHNIFGEEALYKLGFSAKKPRNRTPIEDVIRFTVGTILPAVFKQKLKQRS